jgi:hypothetical protein
MKCFVTLLTNKAISAHRLRLLEVPYNYLLEICERSGIDCIDLIIFRSGTQVLYLYMSRMIMSTEESYDP